jgi:hypothetical protein
MGDILNALEGAWGGLKDLVDSWNAPKRDQQATVQMALANSMSQSKMMNYIIMGIVAVVGVYIVKVLARK